MNYQESTESGFGPLSSLLKPWRLWRSTSSSCRFEKFIFELFDTGYLLEKMTARKQQGKKNRNGTGESRKSQQSLQMGGQAHQS